MIDRDARIKVREENRKTLAEVFRDKETIISREVDKLQRRHADVEKEIARLQDEKVELMTQPVTNEEFLRAAIERLRGARRFAIDFVLKPHLEQCRKVGVSPFDDASMRVSVLPENKLWHLFAFAVTEDDLVEIIGEFPEIGLPEAERTAKIKAIDQKIAKLANGVKQELEGLKSGG